MAENTTYSSEETRRVMNRLEADTATWEPFRGFLPRTIEAWGDLQTSGDPEQFSEETEVVRAGEPEYAT